MRAVPVESEMDLMFIKKLLNDHLFAYVVCKKKVFIETFLTNVKENISTINTFIKKWYVLKLYDFKKSFNFFKQTFNCQ